MHSTHSENTSRMESDQTHPHVSYKEFEDILNTYKVKGYHRFGNVLKAKYGKVWKKETTIPEFVWNYCKTPSAANHLIDLVNDELLDEQHIRKWLTGLNAAIDTDIAFVDREDAADYINKNAEEYKYVHVLGEGADFESDNPTVYSVDASEGDLFHGIVFETGDYDDINNIRFVFDMPSGEYTYIFSKESLEQNLCHLEKDENGNGLYYLTFFKHPVPLVHLTENGVKLRIQVIANDDSEPIDSRPLLTLLNPKLKGWLKNRNLLLALKDDDYLRVGPNKMRIMEYFLEN